MPDAKSDPYRKIAADLFGIPENMVTPEMRSRAKAVAFGTTFGAGPAKILRLIREGDPNVRR